MSFADWVGREETATDCVDPVRVAALAALLEVPVVDGLLPPGLHWVLFPPVIAPGMLRADGQIDGGLLPVPEGRSRMWAGGRLQFLQPLRLGQSVRRVSTIRQAQEKRGQGGNLLFVTVEHAIEGPDGPALIELHDIVYRDAGALAAAPPPVTGNKAAARWSREHRIDDLALFRYSGLTGNPYRIHWDRGWTDTQGLPGLLLHGSFSASLLLGVLAQAEPRRLLEFSYRALAPISDGTPVRAEADPGDTPDRIALRLVTGDGLVAVRGDARFAA